jgi:glutamine cyclotransferase
MLSTGEGIAIVRGEFLVRLTYKEHRGFVHRLDDFSIVREFDYETFTGQGWGLAYDARRHELLVTDGSDYLYFWDADTMREKRFVRMTLPVAGVAGAAGDPAGRVALHHVNEIEVVNGSLLGNVWYSDVIVRIDLETGVVTRAYDFSGLHTRRGRGEDCFNGIAYDASSGDLFVTGKKWPSIYRVHVLS